MKNNSEISHFDNEAYLIFSSTNDHSSNEINNTLTASYFNSVISDDNLNTMILAERSIWKVKIDNNAQAKDMKQAYHSAIEELDAMLGHCQSLFITVLKSERQTDGFLYEALQRSFDRHRNLLMHTAHKDADFHGDELVHLRLKNWETAYRIFRDMHKSVFANVS